MHPRVWDHEVPLVMLFVNLPFTRQLPTIQVNLVVWGDDLVLQWIHAHASVYGGVDFTRFFPRQGGLRIPRSMPGAVHTWNSEHYFNGPVYLVFICYYGRWPSRVCRLARLCASFPRKAPTACATPGTSPIRSLHASSRSPSRTKRPLVLLRPRGDGSPEVTGAPRGSLRAKCVVLTVSLC